MTHRMTLGHIADVAESAALTLEDKFAEERIYDACDYAKNRRQSKIMIYSALRRLKKADRAFALNVLKGKTHHEIGISRQAFCNKLKKVCNCIEPPVNKGRKRNTGRPKDRHLG